MNADRYLRICRWAGRRYADAQGWTARTIGQSLSPWGRIESAAWRRYMAAGHAALVAELGVPA